MNDYNWLWGFGVLFFAGCIAAGLMTGRVPSRGGAITREDGVRVFWAAIAIYAAFGGVCLYELLV
jgi:hypothetical protein